MSKYCLACFSENIAEEGQYIVCHDCGEKKKISDYDDDRKLTTNEFSSYHQTIDDYFKLEQDINSNNQSKIFEALTKLDHKIESLEQDKTDDYKRLDKWKMLLDEAFNKLDTSKEKEKVDIIKKENNLQNFDDMMAFLLNQKMFSIAGYYLRTQLHIAFTNRFQIHSAFKISGFLKNNNPNGKYYISKNSLDANFPNLVQSLDLYGRQPIEVNQKTQFIIHGSERFELAIIRHKNAINSNISKRAEDYQRKLWYILNRFVHIEGGDSKAIIDKYIPTDEKKVQFFNKWLKDLKTDKILA